jgi:hypothetical protein
MLATDIAAWCLTIAVAAGCAWALWRDRPDLALGALFLAASFSGITAPLAGVGIRLEQPAAVAIAGVLAIRHPASVVAVLRAARWPVVLAAVYLVANLVSSALFAPDAVQSLKISLWLAVSLLAGGVAAILIYETRSQPRDRALVIAIVAAACIHSVVAGLQVIAELGLSSDWGVLRGDAPLAKAYGLAWEPNLLAIDLAAAFVFVIEPRTRQMFRPGVRLAAIVLISAGIALSLSRGGIVALVAGIGVVALSIAAAGRARPTRSTLRPVVGEALLALAIAVGGYAGLAWLGTQGVGVRSTDQAYTDDAPDATLTPVGAASQEPTPAATAQSSAAVEPAASPPQPAATTPAGSATARRSGGSDTVGLRWRNLQIAMAGGLTSPIVGLGTDSFGQRFDEPTCQCPAHIPNQLSATFYESGLIGLVSLIALVALTLVRGWQVPLYAYVAAIVALVVGYQVTDAMRFASNWILIGATIGLIVVALGSVRGPFSRARADTPEQSPPRTPPS